MAAFLWFLLSFSLVAGRPQSIFDKAFEDVPQPQPTSGRIPGATPADTFPLVIQPLNFIPAVVAPPLFIYPDHFRIFGRNTVPGAIPIFKPLRDFAYVRFVKLRPGFYLSEPNLRRPFAEDEEEFFPKITKVAAPPPGFLPIRDTQVPHRFQEKQPTLEEEQEDDPRIVNVVRFPSAIGEDPTNLRDTEDTLAFSAPGGIVQSGQPQISTQIFRNSKASPNLDLIPTDTGLLRVNEDNYPRIIEA